jgi:hypothetical protein
MQNMRTIALISLVSITLAASSTLLGGCERKSGPAPDDHVHADGQPHNHHEPAPSQPTEPVTTHTHGVTTQLGERSVGSYTVKASRDGGIKPGSVAVIDVWVTGTDVQVAAVRFWIGTQDAKGSVKAKAELEQDNWHTHAEIPNPMPEGSQLWVEIESDSGETTVVGFDLNT